MKIEYLKHQEIDFVKWDACIQDSLNSYIYAYSWYLDKVSEEWDALIGGDYEYVFPLPYRLKFGVKYIYQPLFTQQLGLFSKSKISAQLTQDFIDAIPSEYKLVDLNFNKYNSVSSHFNPIENVNVELDLIPEYSILKKGYSKNQLRNIKKAGKHNLFIDTAIKPELLSQLFAENKGHDLGVFGADQYQVLHRLAYILIHKGLAQVWGVYSEDNELLGGALFVQSDKRVILLFTGLSSLGKELSAMHFLMDAFIQKFAGSSMVLDFEGSNDPGISRFYMGFGSVMHHYQSVQINRLGSLKKLLHSLYKKVK